MSTIAFKKGKIAFQVLLIVLFQWTSATCQLNLYNTDQRFKSNSLQFDCLNYHIRFFYKDPFLRSNVGEFLLADYVCYDQQLCDSIILNLAHENLTHLNQSELTPILHITGTPWIQLIIPIEQYFHRCSIPHITFHFNNKTKYNNDPSLYNCQNSSKFISKHRIMDNIKDCFEEDDKNYQNSCLLNDRYRVKCHDVTKCWSSIVKNYAYGLSLFHDSGEISFQNFCDGVEKYSYDNNEQKRSTKFGCSNWSCSDGRDQDNCNRTLCPSQTYACISPGNYTMICLPSTLANDGIVHCLGALDEQHKYRKSYSSGETSYCFCCSYVGLCLQISEVCDKKVHCLLGDDERQEIDAYDQFVYIAKQSCSMKLNRYVLFSTRPKNISKNYSVRIDTFETNAITFVESWHFPITFLFLTVNRLSISLNLSNHLICYPINACQNNGQYVPSDLSIPGNNYTCIGPDRCFGQNCEHRKVKLDVSLNKIDIPPYLVAYFFTLSNKSESIETTILQKLTLLQLSVTFHITVPFQLAFIEAINKYYLAILQQSSTKICLCPSCFFGNRCQFYAKGLGSTLDESLGYEFKHNTRLSEQLITRRKPLEAGCGIYLLTSSITSLLTMILFYSHQDINGQRHIPKGNCFGIESLLKVFLYLDNWLNACVAIERTIFVIQGITFNKNRSKRIAIWVNIFLLVRICCFFIPQLIHLHIFYDETEERSWCVVKYVKWLATYSTALLFIHYFVLLIINIVSMICTIVIAARQRAVSQTNRNSLTHLRLKLRKNKHILMSPAIIICFTLPHLIISIILDCRKSSHLLWFYLIGYFLSFCPAAFIFIIFI